MPLTLQMRGKIIVWV